MNVYPTTPDVRHYDKGYDRYDTYYEIPTKQTTGHEALRDKFETWKMTI